MLCTIESTLKNIKDIYPDIPDVACMSDGGSGYKYSRRIIGLRNLKERTGVQISIWHYNAAGEVKRPPTNGAMPAPKLQRKYAMKSGNPTA